MDEEELKKQERRERLRQKILEKKQRQNASNTPAESAMDVEPTASKQSIPKESIKPKLDKKDAIAPLKREPLTIGNR